MSNIDQAFILCAGLGTRMRPLTEHAPKPLMTICGCTLLTHALDHLQAAGVRKVVMNTHYLAEQINDHISAYKGLELHTIYEPELLDTGGGIKNALSYFGGEPFYTLSGDGYWKNPAGTQTLLDLAEFWDSKHMDIALLLQDIHTMSATKGIGDYRMNNDGSLFRTPDHSGGHMFTSMRIHHPRIFENTPDVPFSYLDLMDRAEKNRRLYGLEHRGMWYHLSRPEDLEATEAEIKK